MVSAAASRRFLPIVAPVLLVSAAVLLPWRMTAPAAARSATQETPIVTETVRLKQIDAKSVPAIVKDTSDIEQLTCNLKDNSITVRGSQKAVDAFKAVIKQADVKTPIYVVKLRYVRYHVDAHGKYTEKTLQEPIITEAELSPGMISMQGSQGYAIQVTIGHGVDAGQVEATVEVRELGEQGEVVSSGKNERSLVLGQTARVTGMTNATDKALRRAVQHGEIVTDKGEYTGYYVEVKPTLARYSGSIP